MFIGYVVVTIAVAAVLAGAALGARDAFWLYGAACAAAFYFSLRKVPETKGRTLEEIEASWVA